MSNRDEILKLYNEKRKEFPNLPEADKLDYEMEFIDYLGERFNIPSFLIRSIRRRVADVLGSWINYLHNFVHPNKQSMILVHEAENVSDEDKDTIFKIMNELMFISRISAKLEIQKDEAVDAKFITDVFNMWLDIKKKLVPITQKNINIWEKALQQKGVIEEDKQYFG